MRCTFEGDPDKYKNYPNAVWSGHCVPDDQFPPVPCMCDPGKDAHPGDAVCIPRKTWPPGGVGTPGPEEDPTGGPEATDWMCTNHGASKCVVYNWRDDPKKTPDKYCWSSGGNPCVVAVDAAAAKSLCEDKCEKFRKWAVGEIDKANESYKKPDVYYDEYEIVEPPIDCSLDNKPPGDQPSLLEPGATCSEQSIDHVQPPEVLNVTIAAGMVVNHTEGVAMIQGLTGDLRLEFANCQDDVCAVTLAALTVPEHNVSARFLTGGAHRVEKLSVQRMQPILGRWDRGTIEFPGPVQLAVTATDVLVDGVRRGPWTQPREVHQIVGTLTAEHHLTLTMVVGAERTVVTVTAGPRP